MRCHSERSEGIAQRGHDHSAGKFLPRCIADSEANSGLVAFANSDVIHPEVLNALEANRRDAVRLRNQKWICELPSSQESSSANLPAESESRRWLVVKH